MFSNKISGPIISATYKAGIALNPKKHIQITLAALGRNIKLPIGNLPSLNVLIINAAQITQAVKLKTNVKKKTLRKSRNLSR
jgi:hypothetical protein